MSFNGGFLIFIVVIVIGRILFALLSSFFYGHGNTPSVVPRPDAKDATTVTAAAAATSPPEAAVPMKQTAQDPITRAESSPDVAPELPARKNNSAV